MCRIVSIRTYTFLSLSLWKIYNCLVMLLLVSFVTTSTDQITSNEDSTPGCMSAFEVLCKYDEAIFYKTKCQACLQTKEYVEQEVAVRSGKLSTNYSSYRNGPEKLFVRRNTIDQDMSAGDSKYAICPFSPAGIQFLALENGKTTLRFRKFRVVTIQRAPFSRVSNGKYSGVMFEILMALQEKYNFSMEISTPPDGNFGSMEKNKSWNGMVGQVMRHEAEIGASSFSVTEERSRVIDFTMAIHEEPSAVLIPAPSPGNKFAILVRPFEPEVWGALFLTVFLLVPAFYILHKLSVQISRGQTGHNKIKLKSVFATMSEIFMYITGSLVQESVIAPGNRTTRFLLGIWWMITLVLANTYVGFLVSFLSAPKLFNDVNSLEELVHQKALKWTFRKGTAHQNLFKSDESFGIFKLIGDAVKESDLVLTDMDGVSGTLNQHVAFIKEKSFLEYALGNDFEMVKHCRLTLAKEEFYTVGIAFIVSKRAPFLPVFNSEISHVLATGLMEKWKRMNWPDNLWCVDAASYIISTQPKSRKLNVGDFYGVSLLWFFGISIALTGFIFEHVVKNVSKFSESRTSSVATLIHRSSTVAIRISEGVFQGAKPKEAEVASILR